MTSGRDIAIVGATHVLARDLAEHLAKAGFGGDRIELFDLEEHAGLLTNYGDEARVMLDAAENSLGEFSVVCFCGLSETTTRFAPQAEQAGVVIDCSGAFAAGDDVTFIDMEGSPGAGGTLAVPTSGTLLLSRLATVTDLADSTCTVFLPASDLSDAATAELSQQAAALLNFGDSPADVLGRRLAFDIWPDATPPDGAANRIRAELEALGVTPPALAALRGSIFHGVAASVHFPHLGAEDLRATLAAHAGVETESDGDTAVDSPGRVAGKSGLFVGAVEALPGGGAWAWLLLDNHIAAVEAAVRAIEVRLDPS
jgi:aspartate-semialdehyde dehydrogenase